MQWTGTDGLDWERSEVLMGKLLAKVLHTLMPPSVLIARDLIPPSVLIPPRVFPCASHTPTCFESSKCPTPYVPGGPGSGPYGDDGGRSFYMLLTCLDREIAR